MRSSRFAELIGVRKGGEEFLAEVNVGSVEVDESVFTINVVRDATEPKAVLRALAESEERLRTVANIAADIISESDVETGRGTWTWPWVTNRALTIKSIDLETEFEPRLPRATVDSIQIEQVLINLINLIMNAIDALHELVPEHRSITVSSQYDESHITVSVRDTGHGIAEAALPNLFDTFHTSKPEGLGVGLAISPRLIESHGGRLWWQPPHAREPA